MTVAAKARRSETNRAVYRLLTGCRAEGSLRSSERRQPESTFAELARPRIVSPAPPPNRTTVPPV